MLYENLKIKTCILYFIYKSNLILEVLNSLISQTVSL